ncbi:hypothetical protein KAR91_75635, partial [Candidatus Pacearchaeota archaeon]|nr:hypothetical protein [Candidatus Pacearchaeota archaeon]
MNIQNALKETGKAIYPDQTDVYAEIRFYNGANYLVWINTEDNEISGRVTGEEGGRVAYEMHFKDDWQPYFEVKEIRPEKAGELWEYNAKCLKIFILYGDNLSLVGIDETGQKSTISPFMIHGKNGFTRIEPPVEGVWGKSAILNDKYKAAQNYANEVARQALDFLHE